MPAPDLDKLLRAAASAPNESHDDEMPFGFDTRVLANWRALRRPGYDVWQFARVFRRLTFTAVAVVICAGSAAWWQIQQNEELDSPSTNTYAIADNAIESGTWQ